MFDTWLYYNDLIPVEALMQACCRAYHRELNQNQKLESYCAYQLVLDEFMVLTNYCSTTSRGARWSSGNQYSACAYSVVMPDSVEVTCVT